MSGSPASLRGAIFLSLAGEESFMWTQLCAAFRLTSLLLGPAFGADESLEAQYRVGPLYEDGPGAV